MPTTVNVHPPKLQRKSISKRHEAHGAGKAHVFVVIGVALVIAAVVGIVAWSM